MRRIPCAPRPNWEARVRSQGLVFPRTAHPDGTTSEYWCESAYYELTTAEVDYLEDVTKRLHGMCRAAVAHLASGAVGHLGIPPRALELARASYAAQPPTLYGRFDLAWDFAGDAKLLEYNADTPTGLLEASVAQWFWLEDTFPERDQWNSLHERLIATWAAMAQRRPGLRDAPVHFAHHEAESSGEELMTVTYLRDTADQAGLRTASITMGEIGYDRDRRCFVDRDGDVLRTCFKLYPWEDMLTEEFGGYVRVDDAGSALATTWIEPLWKVLLSNKALLVALWDLFPGHPNLLPAHLDTPGDLTSWVAKPLHGREGANIIVHTGDGPGDTSIVQPGPYGAEGWVYQQYAELPVLDGNRPVLGCWVVGEQPAGLGIRESDSLVTDDRARFVPHLIAAPRPSGAEQAGWLAQDTVSTRPPQGA